MSAVQRALLSVSDKEGLVDFARGLAARGIEILSTGGTASVLRDAGVSVLEVAEYTGFPEIMDGRVKTLHPRVHGGILMRDQASDRKQLASIGGVPIDLVCVNLYPFEATVARGAGAEETIENIDIGGPSMVRSAAKNQDRVLVVTDPSDYERVLMALDQEAGLSPLRAELAAKAFAHTAAYDGAIAAYLSATHSSAPRFAPQSSGLEDAGSREPGPTTVSMPGWLTLQFQKTCDLRYGENPHQRAAFYVRRGAPEGCLARAELLDAGRKELSFNNLVDVDAALDAVREFEEPAAVVVKHTNPCGVGKASCLVDAYRIAREADALSAFGGIVALNRPVDLEVASAIQESFIECVVAPSFETDAIELLRKKKNLRLLATGAWRPADHAAFTYKRIDGGIVAQERDATASSDIAGGRVVSRRVPTDAELRSMEFAWKVSKHVKSNAIVLAHEDRTLGIGAGQMSRVLSVEIACQKAGSACFGASMASDAFFPFPDSVEVAASAGVKAIVQPGGSKRDPDVIDAADRVGIAMLFTGARHFRH
ncbi:MAG: bifunctional phosphoribosylaminoimidazolecarboxamide formyltransferase/IMP cyclohydrolase [Myxococcota bacterium]